MARATPVLPEVASTTVSPGLSRPRCSASRMMARARRSLTEPPGLKDSTFAYIVTPPAATRFRRTTGVPPMVSRMLSWILGLVLAVGGKARLRRNARGRHRLTGTPYSAAGPDGIRRRHAGSIESTDSHLRPAQTDARRSLRASLQYWRPHLLRRTACPGPRGLRGRQRHGGAGGRPASGGGHHDDGVGAALQRPHPRAGHGEGARVGGGH